MHASPPFGICALAKPDETLTSAAAGSDSALQRNYSSMGDLWKTVVPKDSDADSVWYDKSLAYWAEQTDDVSGVMGGFPELHEVDMRNAKAVLAILKFKYGMVPEVAIDCGAGMGRVAEHLLAPFFSKQVHVLEPVPKLLLKAYRNFLAAQSRSSTDASAASSTPAVGDATSADAIPWTEMDAKVEGEEGSVRVRLLPNVELPGGPTASFWGVPLQRFGPKAEYDLVLMEWVSLYLLDQDFVAVLSRFRDALRRPADGSAEQRWGYIYLKDNFLEEERFIYDEGDTSVTRSLQHVIELSARAGLKCVLIHQEQDWPTKMLAVFTVLLTHADAPFADVSVVGKSGGEAEKKKKGKR